MPTEFIVSVPRNRLGIAVTGGLPRLPQRFFFLHTLLFLIKKNNAKIYNKTKDTVLLNTRRFTTGFIKQRTKSLEFEYESLFNL